MEINRSNHFTNVYMPLRALSGQNNVNRKDLARRRMVQTENIGNLTPTKTQGIFSGISAMFGWMSAVSGNPSAVKIRSSGSLASDTSILVNQIAKAQRNEGRSMTTNGLIQGGTHEFEIRVDGKTHRLSFTTDGPMTNHDFQQRMADVINRSNIGVRASVSMDADGTRSALSLESFTTGDGNGQPRFAIQDIRGNAVSTTGISAITQEGRNAIFYINGARHVSSTNDVTLYNGVEITLLNSSEGEVSITFEKDIELIISGLEAWVDRINSLLEIGNRSDASDRAVQIAKELTQMIQEYRTLLEQLGILVTSNGFLTTDEHRLRQSINNGMAEDFFANRVDRYRFNMFA